MTTWLSLALLLLAGYARAGDVLVAAAPIGLAGRPVAAQATIAAVPDVQNYCSTEVNPIMVSSLGVAHLRALAADIIALRPDAVIQVGDLTDNTGGVDQNGTAADADDPDTFVTTPAQYTEWTCVKTNFFDLLDAAGIPYFYVSGNHDSYRDFERAFPRATFLAKSYGYAAQNEINRWHVGWNDTEERAARFTTPIGPLCVVGGDYTLDNGGGTLDATFISNNIGCGGTTPTIIVRHDLPTVSGMGTGSAANSEIFLALSGHVDNGPGGVLQSVTSQTPTSGELKWIFTNSQEVSLACGGTARDGTSMHTGVAWWTVLTIVPSENKVNVQARNPIYGGASRDPACGSTYQNTSSTYAPSLCTRFPSLLGC